MTTESDPPSGTPFDGLLLSLIADALALGPHWIYAQREIADTLGTVEGYLDPATDYHPGKKAGDQTHYGDQILVLLRSLAREGTFDLAAFAGDWRAFWEDPQTQSYRDGATRSTLEHLQAGGSPETPGSPSNDLAGAARITPLQLLTSLDDGQRTAAARAQTALTHGDPSVIEAAVFFSRMADAVGQGSTIPAAVRAAAAQADRSNLPPSWLAAAEGSAGSGEIDRRAVKEHGLTCHIPEAFPATLHLLLRYPDDPATALKTNVQSGGDGAARGILLGYIYGNAYGLRGIPQEWIEGLNVADEVHTLAQALSPK